MEQNQPRVLAQALHWVLLLAKGSQPCVLRGGKAWRGVRELPGQAERGWGGSRELPAAPSNAEAGQGERSWGLGASLAQLLAKETNSFFL